MFERKKSKDQLVANLIKGGLIALAGAAATTVFTAFYRRKHSIPKNAEPVTPFDLEQYLGKWYEVARLDNRWERNLSDVTAEYNVMEDGRVQMINSGYNYKKEQWVRSEAVAQFVGDPNTAALEISYFGPIFTGYNVIAIEGDYEYALVVGRNTKQCWILSRTKELPEEVRARFVTEAMKVGVRVNNLIWVDHSMELEE
ncbi:lipocalin family protein [uncultured Porphyromonas sp.]|uniref:lipocalin family protein n=1 Tax=uncultured Porphyromonas sp. TaxID=159274 RepID=UPI002595C66F|nr:lipocalin family protein [uncultured Porphyromonas sp.]